jgi:hypothetical protein
MGYLTNYPEPLSAQSYLLHLFRFPDEGSGNVCTNNGKHYKAHYFLHTTPFEINHFATIAQYY